MSGRSVATSGTSGPPISSSDINQPMDLAQKSQTSRIADVTNAVKGGTTFVQFGNTQLIASSASSKSGGIRNENLGVSGGVTLFSRPVSHGALNLASSGSGNSLNSFSSNVTVGARSHPTSTSVTVATSSSVPPSGYHIPRGAAAVANMTASRSQNLASIVRTTAQIIGSPTTTLTSPRTSIISQRMVPISNNSWINRGTSTTAVLTTKATSSPVTGRVPVSSGRSSQSPGMPSTYHGGSVKSGSVVTGTIRPHGSSTVRVGATSEGAQKSSHATKGITVPHPVSHAQKYIGSSTTSAIRGVGASSFITPGNAGTSNNTVYTPTSTLVTSLASSGTTITPHPGNRSQPLNTVRLTSAVTTVFTQASTQANSTSLGGICLTPSSTGTILAHHSSTLARTHAVEQLSVKTPLARTSHPSIQSHGIKGSAGGLPVGTHISISGPKVISQPTQVPTLALAQLSNVSGSKTHGSVITTQAGLSTTPFQSRAGTMVTPSIGRSGPTISMAKVIPQVKGPVSQCLSTSLPAITATSAPLTSCVTSGIGPDSQSPHSSVFVHRTSHPGPMTTGTTVAQNERTAPTVTHYSIATPYYLDSNPTTFPVNASIVPGNHYIPSNVNSSTIRVGGNGAMNNVTATCESSNHQGMSVPIIKTNSSPRPSILRKRSDMESGVPLKAAKNLSAALNIPLTSPPSPIRPDSRGNGNISSGSSTVSANSSPGLQLNEEDSMMPSLKLAGGGGSKTEAQSNENVPPASCIINFPVASRPLTTNVNDHTVVSSSIERGVLCAQNSVPFSLSIPQVMEGVSPRKKPRKQQLMGNELHEVRSGEDDFENHIAKKVRKEPQNIRPSKSPPSPESDEERDNGVEPQNPIPDSWRETTPSPEPVLKIPHMSLMNSYRQTWKARHNHFFKHSDVRPKEEKKRTVNEIANQKLAMQRVNGWKVMHLLGQVEDLSEMEGDVKNRLQAILNAIEKRQQQRKPYKDFDKDVNRLSELVKANIQRSVIIKDQMTEAKVQMSKIFNHKENIVNILTKYGNTKRNLRKKERL